MMKGLKLSVADRFNMIGMYASVKPPEFDQADRLLKEIIKEAPNDPKIRGWDAQLTLWRLPKRPELGLAKLEAIIKDNLTNAAGDFVDPELVSAYIDGASASKKMTKPQLQLAQRIAADVLKKPDSLEHPAIVFARLAWALYRNGDKERAEELIATAVKIESEEEQRVKADVLVAMTRAKEALPLVEELLKAHPNDEFTKDLEIQVARVTSWAGEYKLAVERLLTLLKRDFEQPELWVNYVESASAMKKGELNKEQLALVEKIALRPVPDAVAPEEERNDKKTVARLKADFLSHLAWTLFREGQKENVPEYLQAAFALADPLNPREDSVRKTRAELASVLSATGNYKEALKWQEELVRLYPLETDLRIQLAETQLAMKTPDPQSALESMQRLLKEKFDQPRVWVVYINAALGLKKLTKEQREIVLKIAQQPVPDDALEKDLFPAHVGWVLIRESRDRANMAAFATSLKTLGEKLLDDAVAMNPEDPGARLELARLLVAANKTKIALPWIQQLAKDDPDDQDLQKLLAQVTVWSDQPAEGLGMLFKLLTAKFDQPDLWATYIDAASAFTGKPTNGKLTPEQLAVLTKISDLPMPEDTVDKVGYYTPPRVADHAIESK